MAKHRLRAVNASALYIHMTPELLKSLKTKLVLLRAPSVEIKLTTFRNQYKPTKSAIKVSNNLWLEGYLAYPDLCKVGEKIETYWRFKLTHALPF
ncbi:MAG: hypothetical protein [Bacteriophage sp.]|nr:MAG: hypothetical protein [Bacteriophage sp.]